MKTVLVDNSLCAYPLRDDANPSHIFSYICALRDSGVKYIELDFRTLMKLRELPEGAEYILRMVDPMFLRLTEFYNFRYILLNYSDIKRKIKTDVPVMFETPFPKGGAGRMLRFVKSRVDGDITAFRLRSDFEYTEPHAISGFYRSLCAELAPVSVSVCPLNKYKTALDTALKFTASGCDSVTLTAGLPEKYASLEEYIFALMTIFDSLPPEISIKDLGKVSVFRSVIFQRGEQALPKLLDLLEYDIRRLTNSDTGDRVDMRVCLKDTEYMNREYLSALRKMASFEDIPPDVFEDISAAIKHYDRGIFNDELLVGRRKGLLN